MRNTIIGIGLILLSIIGFYALAWVSHSFDIYKEWYALPAFMVTFICIFASLIGALYTFIEQPFKTDKG